MEETGNAASGTEVVQQTAIDTTGIAFAAVVAIMAAALLIWHIQQVKRRPATTYDKMVGGLWAALIVLAIGRAISIAM